MKVSCCQELPPFCKDLIAGRFKLGFISATCRQLKFGLYSQLGEGTYQHFWDELPRVYLFLAFGDCTPSFCAPVSRDTPTEHEIWGIRVRRGCPDTRSLWQDYGVQCCAYSLCSVLCALLSSHTPGVFLGGQDDEGELFALLKDQWLPSPIWLPVA